MMSARGLAPAFALLALTACDTIQKPPTLSGPYGGPHIGLLIQGGLGDVQFDCAAGTIDDPFPSAKEIPFHLTGTYRAGATGPVRVGQIFSSQPATYTGTVNKDNSITLSVALDDGTAFGPFTLTPGATPQLTHCQ